MLLEHTREERQERLAEGMPHVFELPALVEALRAEPAYETEGRCGTTLVKTPQLRVVLQALRAEMGLAQHRVPGPITLQVLEGELRLQAEEEIFYLLAGQVITLPGGMPHAVEAVHDTAFLITIGAEPETPPG